MNLWASLILRGVLSPGRIAIRGLVPLELTWAPVVEDVLRFDMAERYSECIITGIIAMVGNMK